MKVESLFIDLVSKGWYQQPKPYTFPILYAYYYSTYFGIKGLVPLCVSFSAPYAPMLHSKSYFCPLRYSFRHYTLRFFAYMLHVPPVVWFSLSDWLAFGFFATKSTLDKSTRTFVSAVCFRTCSMLVFVRYFSLICFRQNVKLKHYKTKPLSCSMLWVSAACFICQCFNVLSLSVSAAALVLEYGSKM